HEHGADAGDEAEEPGQARQHPPTLRPRAPGFHRPNGRSGRYLMTKTGTGERWTTRSLPDPIPSVHGGLGRDVLGDLTAQTLGRLCQTGCEVRLDERAELRECGVPVRLAVPEPDGHELVVVGADNQPHVAKAGALPDDRHGLFLDALHQAL